MDFLNWGGKEIEQFRQEAMKSWALFLMDHKLLRIFAQKKEPGKFIDIGSNDGINQSNTYFFEHYFNWRGILIEPILNVFNKSINNRSSENTFINAALISDNYNSDSIEMIYTHKNQSADALMSVINDENAEKLMNRHKDVGEIVNVPAMSLNHILELYGNKYENHFDLVSIDAEGYETKILENFDFEKYTFDYILIEELEENQNIENILSRYFRKAGKFSVHDYLYQNRKLC